MVEKKQGETNMPYTTTQMLTPQVLSATVNRIAPIFDRAAAGQPLKLGDIRTLRATAYDFFTMQGVLKRADASEYVDLTAFRDAAYPVYKSESTCGLSAEDVIETNLKMIRPLVSRNATSSL